MAAVVAWKPAAMNRGNIFLEWLSLLAMRELSRGTCGGGRTFLGTRACSICCCKIPLVDTYRPSCLAGTAILIWRDEHASNPPPPALVRLHSIGQRLGSHHDLGRNSGPATDERALQEGGRTFGAAEGSFTHAPPIHHLLHVLSAACGVVGGRLVSFLVRSEGRAEGGRKRTKTDERRSRWV